MLWKVLKSAPNSGAKGSLPTSINDDSSYVTEPHEIAGMFNLHFSSIADNVLAATGTQHQNQNHNNEEILDTVNRFVHQRAPTGVPHLSIPPVPGDFLSQQIEGLSTNKAKGIDSLNVKLLKMARPMIKASLLYIYFIIQASVWESFLIIGKLPRSPPFTNLDERKTSITIVLYLYCPHSPRSWSAL